MDEPLRESSALDLDQPEKDPNVSTASQKSQSPPRSPHKSIHKEESIEEENMDLDFEEISEDELEEESRVKGIGDALGVDWASLVAESRPRLKPMSSAKLRWEAHNVLINSGVSVQLAGKELVQEIIARAEIKEEIKEEPNVNGIEEVKREKKEVSALPHPIAAIQVAEREQQAVRRTLFSSVGSQRRALSARRDLALRRHLCNLPVNDAFVEAPKRHDPELFKAALELFERCL